MINALNINSTVGIFFEDWVEITEGDTLDYEVSLYEGADLDKVIHAYFTGDRSYKDHILSVEMVKCRGFQVYHMSY